MIKRKQFRHGANSANPKSLFEVLGLDKSNDPNYKLNPSFMSSGRAGRDGPQYILKTQDEIAESFLQPNVPINLQGTSVDEYMANYNKGELNNLNLNAINSIFTGNQITEENIKKTVEEENNNLNKHTGLGNMLARLGGGQIATEEERAAATPELRELYNQQRLAARNRGIGQMLFALSDAFAGRDIGTGFLERQRFLQPEKEKLTAAQQNLQAFYKIYNNPNATQEDKRFALSLIGGIGKSKKQLREEVAKSLVTAVNPIGGLPYTKDEINQQLELFDELLSNSNENKPNEPTPTNIFKVGGYTIEGG